MHHNFYFLKHLSKALYQVLDGYTLVEAFSQNKDELILAFLKGRDEFYIKASLGNKLNMISFPTEFARARKNSIDLFQELIDLKVTGVRQFLNERSYCLQFDSGYSLLFKMHGNRSNIILFQGDQIIRMFNNKMKNDLQISLENLDRPIDQSFEAYQSQGLRSTYPTFDKKIHQELAEREYKETLEKSQYDIVQGLLADLEPPFYVYSDETSPPFLSLFQTEKQLVTKSSDPIRISNELFYSYTKEYFLKTEQTKLISAIDSNIKKSYNYIQKSTRKLKNLQETARHEEIANIIMANLHNIPSQQKEVVLNDFYTNQEIKIKLNPSLTPQKNAENYYRKAKNQKIEVETLSSNIEKKEAQILELESQKELIEAAGSMKELRKLGNLPAKSVQKANKEDLPFRKLKVDDWEIWIGKSAKNNDELTLKHANKDDLWLHAKDVSGSHVVIKQKPGLKYPEPIIEKAAQLAAYYSKRKTDSLCPVIFTPKKYVRKPKGMAPGQVIVDREQVVLVEPSPPDQVS